jgi:hypothetical protein
VLVFASPEHPMRGEPVRVIAVADHLVDAKLVVTPRAAKTPVWKTAPAPSPVVTSDRQGGPPYYWITTLDKPAAGAWQATLARSDACGEAGAPIATRDVAVTPYRVHGPDTPRTSLWFVRDHWSPSLENLYSAWIQHLFDAPLEAQPSFAALHEVLRDRDRNFLFDYLGDKEDEQGVIVRPDCADLPYFLRAYFSFKLGLPFGWSHCTRGEAGSPPTCSDFASTSDPFPPPTPDPSRPPPAPDASAKPRALPTWADPERERVGPWEVNVKRLGEFFRTTLADAAQSGAGRTPAEDETGDYYPVALTAEGLRPGTIYADPYGHVLVLAKRIPQTATSGGVLLAVDGQPDGTVARKRFWRGNFLFAIDPALGSPGFKRFRPIVPFLPLPPGMRESAREAAVRKADNATDPTASKWRHATNRELPDYSGKDQYTGGVEGFYDKMDDVLSPAPLDPTQALLETIQALEEQVKTRVTSIENGRKFLASGKPAADMPDGARIFETTGEWEDFSTPSRDLRLLIAVDVARALPGRVARRPERYAMPPGLSVDQVRASLEARLASELVARSFKYTRTDGSEWVLHLKDIVDRQVALEMAYNPNDCVEARWGATEGSDEAKTCGAHAPGEQTAKMAGYRAWFHERRRPPR